MTRRSFVWAGGSRPMSVPSIGMRSPNRSATSGLSNGAIERISWDEYRCGSRSTATTSSWRVMIQLPRTGLKKIGSSRWARVKTDAGSSTKGPPNGLKASATDRRSVMSAHEGSGARWAKA